MIRIECSNGHKLKVKDQLAGKALKCPSCGAKVVVPAIAPAAQPPQPRPRKTRPPQQRKPKAPEPAYDEHIDDEPNDEFAGNDDEWGWDGESDDGLSGFDPVAAVPQPPGRVSLPGSPGPKKKRRQDQAAAEKKSVPVMWFVAGGGAIALILIGVVVAVLVLGGSDPGDAGENTTDGGSAQPLLPPPGTTGLPGVAASEGSVSANTTVAANPNAGQPPPGPIVTMIAESPAIPSAPRDEASLVTLAQINETPPPKKTTNNATAAPPRRGPAMEVTFPEASTIAVGRRVVIRLPKNSPTDVEFAVVSAGDATAEPQWIKPLAELPMSGPNSVRIGMSAAVNDQQELIYVTDDTVALLSNLKLPVDLRMGTERMKVTEIDSFKGALRIERSDGIWHSVTEPAYVGGGDGDAAYFEKGQPLRLDEQSLHWVPTADFAGEKIVRLRWDANRSFGEGSAEWNVTISDGPPSSTVNPEALVAEARPKDIPFEVWDRPEEILAANPNPNAQSQPTSRKDQAAISKVLTALRRAKEGIFVRFQPGLADALEVQLRPATQGGSQVDVQQVQVDSGAGVPLYEFKGARWDPKDWDKQGRDLAGDFEELTFPATDPLCRLHQLLPLMTEEDLDGLSDTGTPYRRVLWSTDGKSLYVLMAGSRALHRIDVDTWQIAVTVQPNVGIRDLTLCSQGIAALASPGSPRAGSGGMDDGWMQLEPRGDQQAMADAQQHILLLMDPETLAVRSVLHVAGDAIAGTAVSDLVYTQDVGQQTIAVIDIKEKALLNVVSFAAAGREIGNPAAGTTAPPVASSVQAFGKIAVTADARYLIGYGAPGRMSGKEFSIVRFAIDGASLTPDESREDVPSATDIPFLTNDGSLICFIRNGKSRKVEFLQTTGLSRFTHSMTVGQPTQVLAADPASRSILCALPKTTSGTVIGSDAGKVVLGLYQYLDSTEIPLGEDRVLAIHAHPLGRGFLVTTLKSLYWVELLSEAEYWPFEWNAPASMPVVKSELKSSAPGTPISPDAKSNDRMTVIDIAATALAWTPDGSAYFALVHTPKGNNQHAYSIHRFDAATNTETHRFEPPIGSPVVPTMFTTTTGVLFDDRSNRNVFLLSFEDLNPVWEMDARYAGFANGHHDHGHIAATGAGGYVLFEALDGRIVARASDFDLETAWPDSSMDRISWIVATPDPDVVEFWAGETAVFRAVDGHFRAERLVPNSGPRRTLKVEEAQYTPDGYQYELESSTRVQRAVVLRDDSGQVARRITQPPAASIVAGHPTDPSLALFSSGGELLIVRTPLR